MKSNLTLSLNQLKGGPHAYFIDMFGDGNQNHLKLLRVTVIFQLFHFVQVCFYSSKLSQYLFNPEEPNSVRGNHLPSLKI